MSELKLAKIDSRMINLGETLNKGQFDKQLKSEGLFAVNLLLRLLATCHG
jgi:hypothetical protein